MRGCRGLRRSIILRWIKHTHTACSHWDRALPDAIRCMRLLQLTLITETGTICHRSISVECMPRWTSLRQNAGDNRRTDDCHTAAKCCSGEEHRIGRLMTPAYTQWWCFDIYIEISIRYRYIVSYRPRKYRNFWYTGINFLIYHLAEFSRVVSRSSEIFIETFTNNESFDESFNKKFHDFLTPHVKIQQENHWIFHCDFVKFTLLPTC